MRFSVWHTHSPKYIAQIETLAGKLITHWNTRLNHLQDLIVKVSGRNFDKLRTNFICKINAIKTRLIPITRAAYIGSRIIIRRLARRQTIQSFRKLKSRLMKRFTAAKFGPPLSPLFSPQSFYDAVAGRSRLRLSGRISVNSFANDNRQR
ncbi:MAG: hypothetical protein AAF732_17095 [Pseudomonadota bacterium]